MAKRLNRKQRTAIRRSRNATFNLESFSTRDWNLEDWERLPKSSEGWRAVPDNNLRTVRIKAIHFSDGVTRRFYLQIPRPETLRELRQLEASVAELVQEVRQTLTAAICNREKAFIKQPYRPRRKKSR